MPTIVSTSTSAGALFSFRRSALRATVACLAVSATPLGCSGPQPHKPGLDDLGCVIPPDAVFTSVGVRIEAAQAVIGAASARGASAETRPNVTSLISKGEHDELFAAYIECRMRAQLPREWASFYVALGTFMRTHPTADQLTEYMKVYPAPKTEPQKLENEAQKPKDYLTGRWLLRPQGLPPELVGAWMRLELHGTVLKAYGDSWRGDGSFRGENGYYDWIFQDGKSGTTKIRLDNSGILFGEVRGSRIDWIFWATRQVD